MGVLLNYGDVKKQSLAVWGQFGESKWLPFAKENSQLPSRPAEEIKFSGLGKFCVLAAMGESLQEAIPLLKKYRDRFDLVTCDKGFGALVSQGITPDYVQLADCNISYERWLAPYVEKTEGVKLLSTCYANTDWTKAWRGPRYFYVNRDAIGSEKKFSKIMGPIRAIPAGSNVSNAMAIFMVGVDETTQVNWAGYEDYFLLGYDYSWRPRGVELSPEIKQGSYYAFNDPVPKRYYMSHRTMHDIKGDICHTSENLLFSAKWLYSYITAYNLPITNCSGRGILDIPNRMDFARACEKMASNPERVARVRQDFKMLQKAHDLADTSKSAFESSRRLLWQ